MLLGNKNLYLLFIITTKTISSVNHFGHTEEKLSILNAQLANYIATISLKFCNRR